MGASILPSAEAPFAAGVYQLLIIGGVTDGLVPRQMISRYRNDPKRYEKELERDRSLLFAAATRARDELAVFWHDTPSPFRPEQLTRGRSTPEAGIA